MAVPLTGVSAVEHALYEKLTSNTFECLLDCHDIFQRFATGGVLSEYVHEQLEKLVADPEFSPNLGSERTITMCSNDRFQIFLTILPEVKDEKARFVSGSNNHHLIACVAGGPITLATFAQDLGDFPEIFDRERVLRPVGNRSLAPGDVYAVRASADAFTVIHSPEALLMRMTTPMVSRVRWDYDVETLQPLRAVTAHLVDSRTEFAVQILERLGEERSVDILAGLAREHPAHFVRWAAVKAVAALDSERAIDLLRRAAADAHPHVRIAAQSTLRANAVELQPA